MYADQDDSTYNKEANQPHPIAIEPLTMAMYSSLNFNQLDSDGVIPYRYLVVEIIISGVKTKDGANNFLVMDRASESNRVLRVQISPNVDDVDPSYLRQG